MRKLFIAACVLLVVMWLACTIEFPVRNSARHSEPARHEFATTNDWRRTVNGWERSSTWKTQPTATAPPALTNVHPGLIAGFQVLVSIGSLLAFSNATSDASMQEPIA